MAVRDDKIIFSRGRAAGRDAGGEKDQTAE
jgi:hypothetical protein